MKKEKRFEMRGSNDILISQETTWECGGEMGFLLRYDNHGGGVLSRKEARKLAKFILSKLDNRK